MSSRRPSRAVLYLRLSEQDDASTGIARQEADLRARCEREGLEVARVLVDDGFSGRRSRANAEAALDLLRSGEADVLAVWRFDRWSRQGLAALAALIEVLDERPGACFIADRDGLSSEQPAWRIIASVLAEVARMESESTSARVTSSIDALRRQQRFAGGTVPYGYRPAPNPDGPGRVLVVDEEEAAIVREVAARVLDEGEPAYRIAADLNRRGIAAPRSERRRRRRAGEDVEDADPGRWSVQGLRRTITGDALLGRVTHRAEILRDDRGLPLTVWKPILAPAQISALREALLPARDGTPRPPRRRASRVLSGLVVCSECGARLYVRHTGRHTVYGCPTKRNGGICNTAPRISAPALEDFVAGEALDRIGDLERTTTTPVVLDETAEDLSEVEEAIQHLSGALMEPDADLPALLERREYLLTRREALREQQQRPTTLYRLTGTGRTYRQDFEAEDASVEDRRAILSAIVERVRVGPALRRTNRLDRERVEVHWRPE